MRTQFTSSRVLTILALSLTAVFLMSAKGEAGPPGLNYDARQELKDAGVDKYLGEFTATESTFGVWTKHTFDPQYIPDASYPSGIGIGIRDKGIGIFFLWAKVWQKWRCVSIIMMVQQS